MISVIGYNAESNSNQQTLLYLYYSLKYIVDLNKKQFNVIRVSFINSGWFEICIVSKRGLFYMM